MVDSGNTGDNSGSRGTACKSEQAAGGSMQQFVPQQQQQQQQQIFSPAGGPWVKYYIQRVNTNVNHVLFYVVDAAGTARLAVVGTDVKLSGHFVYASVSDMQDAPPLRCTNRQRVLQWLAALGARELADDYEVKLPQLAPSHWQQLHSSSPMMLKPKLDRAYTSWREDTGILPDGRHYKHFLLVDASTGTERLAVVGEDSVRQDRRYTYKALEDVGGFCFENGKAVSDWLDFVCGRTSMLPTHITRPRPPERKRSRKKQPAAGATTEEEGEMEYGGLNASSSGRLASLPFPPGAQQLARYSSGGLPPSGMYAPPQSLPFDQQYITSSPMQQQQLAGYGAPQQPLQGGAGFGTAASSAAGGAVPPALQGARVDMQEAVRAAGEEVRQLFEVGGQLLLTFVTHVPNTESVNLVSEMGRRLGSFVEALGLTGNPGASTVDAAEAMSILQFLSERPASLKLLETTGVGRPVALLGCMHDVLAAQGQQLRPEAVADLQPVHEVARQLASVWQDLALTAQKLVDEASPLLV